MARNLRFKITVTKVEIVATAATPTPGASPVSGFAVSARVDETDNMLPYWPAHPEPMGREFMIFANSADDFGIGKSYWITATPAD